MKFNSIKDVKYFLDAMPQYGREGSNAADFSLDHFKKFCSVIGNPQKRFRAVHAAGSNGKGSTCRIIASIYKNAGHKTGLFTSPHLFDVKERFKINDKLIPDEELLLFFQKYFPLIKSLQLTYFEISTAIAFWWFARKEIDIGIIETGLGGRLDATNVITPLVSVITSVSLEHTGILGSDLKAITREIAGIIKPGVPVIIGPIAEEARQVIKKTAAEKNSNVSEISELKPQLRAGTFRMKKDNTLKELAVPYQVPVQANNIALAWAVCHKLSGKISVDDEKISTGIRQAGRDNPARFEKIHPSYQWYFDGAHNAEALRSVKEAVDAKGNVSEAVLVLSIMKDKLNKKMIKELSDFKKIVYYTLSTKRAAAFTEVQDRLPRVKSFPADKTSRHSFLDEIKKELVIFSGSFYFYPTVKKWITLFSESR